MKTLVKNGRIITALESYVADILVDGEQVVGIGRDLPFEADRVIDASGQYVVPGAIDVHTHVNDRIGGADTLDDFETGTIAAALGGTTTIVNYASQIPGQPLTSTFERWSEKARGKAAIDFGFHLIVKDLSEERVPELAEVVGQGITSFKVFLANPGVTMVDDATLFRLLRQARQLNALVNVHAESGWVIDAFIKQALAEGRSGPGDHPRTRPAKTEAEATHRAIAFAEIAEAPVYIVHMSSAEALQHVAEARDRGLPVYGETCPQYLLLDEAVYSLPDAEAARYAFTPPARAAGDRAALWQGLATNQLQVLASDHVAFSMAQKVASLDDFTRIPKGAAGIETRPMLAHSKGVLEGKLGLSRWVEVTSTAPAKIFGLFPKKGTIAVGSDADLVIFDPCRETVLSAQTLHMLSDYSIYEGTRVQGMPVDVLSRGKVIVENATFVGKPGDGRFLKRAGFGGTLAN